MIKPAIGYERIYLTGSGDFKCSVMEAEQVEERAGNQNYVTEEKKLIRDHTRGKRLQKVSN